MADGASGHPAGKPSNRARSAMADPGSHASTLERPAHGSVMYSATAHIGGVSGRSAPLLAQLAPPEPRLGNPVLKLGEHFVLNLGQTVAAHEAIFGGNVEAEGLVANSHC